MTTELKIVSKCRNSKKSTGPKSPAGERVSSFNALGSGIFAKSLLIPGEDPNEYVELLKAVFVEHAPQGVFEEFYLSRAVRGMWGLKRLDGAAQTLYEQIRDTILRRKKTRLVQRIHEGMTAKQAAAVYARTLAVSDHPFEYPAYFEEEEPFSGIDEVSQTASEEVRQIDILGLTILEANIGKDERSPMAEIDRRARATVRDITQNLAAFFDLRAQRATINPERP